MFLGNVRLAMERWAPFHVVWYTRSIISYLGRVHQHNFPLVWWRGSRASLAHHGGRAWLGVGRARGPRVVSPPDCQRFGRKRDAGRAESRQCLLVGLIPAWPRHSRGRGWGRGRARGVGLGGKGVGVPAGCAVDRASQTNFAFAPQPRPARVPVRPGVLLARPLCPAAPPHGPACIRALRLPRPAWPRISRFTQRPLRFVGARHPMSAVAIAVATAGQKFENVMLLQNGTYRNIASLACSNIFGICVVSM